MIAYVARLTLGEWYKVRRRWLPWILLGVVVLITQALLWGFYIGYHVSEDAFGSLLDAYEYNGSAGRIEVTCGDLVEGRVEEKLAPLSGDEIERVSAEVEEWSATCVDYVSPQESRGVFTLPFSITLSESVLPFIVIPVMILAASVVGFEYGLGTLRATLTKGVGRWQFLTGKLAMLVLACVGGLLVMTALTAVASIATGIIPPAEEGSISATRSDWMDALQSFGKMVYALVPYIALAAFLAVVTRSTAQGISLSLGYYVVELILVPILGNIADWLENAMEVALIGQNATEWMRTGDALQAQQALGAAVEQPDHLRAALVILGYTAAAVAASLWIFHREDVAGAKGD